MAACESGGHTFGTLGLTAISASGSADMATKSGTSSFRLIAR